jgi:hypothetical protein
MVANSRKRPGGQCCIKQRLQELESDLNEIDISGLCHEKSFSTTTMKALWKQCTWCSVMQKEQRESEHHSRQKGVPRCVVDSSYLTDTPDSAILLTVQPCHNPQMYSVCRTPALLP